MNPEETVAAGPATDGEVRRQFTLEQANRALVLVRRVVRDIVDRYGRLLELRTRRHDFAHRVGPQPELARLRENIERHIVELNQLHGELTEIGCVLKDWAAGLVDFPAVYQGRAVWLCWRLGEAAVTHWHELDAGFAGRQPVGPDFA